jgi:hypothetical protein
MEKTFSIKINRLVIAIAITFLVADTYPHPQLSPGVVETLSSRVKVVAHELLQR